VRVKPDYYRRQACRSREPARSASDRDIKAHLLSVAEQYEKLAIDAEADNQSPLAG
jgi:hypothetical protein